MSLPLEGGVYTGKDLADKVFYGFDLNVPTGDLNIRVIDDETSIVVEPDQTESPYIVDPEAYRAYMWSRDTINFSFNPANGHLLMTYL